MVDKLIDILDANWIATLLSIVFSLYIFLLSIPTLFFQTFLPEEIREVYNRYDTSNGGMNEVKFLRNALLFALFFFGNHAIRFLLSIMSHDYLKGVLIVAFYLGCLSYLIWFTFKSYSLFNSIVFIRKNSRKEVLINISKKIEEAYTQNGNIDNQFICDLAELSKSYSSFVNKELLISHLDDLIFKILNNKTKVYNGVQLKDFIQDVLIDSVVSEDFSIEKNYRQIIKLSNKIAVAQKSNQSTYDQQKLILLLNKVSLLSLEYDYIKPFDKSIELLKTFESTQDDLYKIYKRAFAMKKYVFITDEISSSLELILSSSEESKKRVLFNFFAYLSWYLSSELLSMKFFSNQILNEIETKVTFKRNEIEEAISNFRLLSEYETADSIQNCLLNPSIVS